MDYAETIDRTIKFHHTIRGHIKLVGEAITDREALYNLSKESVNWLPGQPDVAEKQQRLVQTLLALEEGLNTHFSFEEEYLPPIIGPVLMKAIMLDHRRIKDTINNTRSLVDNKVKDSVNTEEVMHKQLHVHQVINELREMIEEHARKEDILLDWLKKSLDEIT